MNELFNPRGFRRLQLVPRILRQVGHSPQCQEDEEPHFWQRFETLILGEVE